MDITKNDGLEKDGLENDNKTTEIDEQEVGTSPTDQTREPDEGQEIQYEVESDSEDSKVELNETEVVEDISDIEKVKLELQKVKEQMLRDRAELENFKRRTKDEMIRDRKYAQQFILGALIGLDDNFERALSTENYESVEKFKEGIILIKNQLNDILNNENVKEIEALHKPFDPNIHQAVLTDSNDDYEDDTVLEVLQKGYMYKDRILRPSMVKVNKKEN